MNSPCLTLDQILSYLKGNLSNTERMKVQQHISSCELCSEAVEGYSDEDLDDVPRIIDTLKDEIRKNNPLERRSAVRHPTGSSLLYQH